MHSEFKDDKIHKETQQILLDLAQTIVAKHHAKLERLEIEEVTHEDEKLYTLALFVSGIAVKDVVQMNVDLATSVVQLHSKICHERINLFNNINNCPNENEDKNDLKSITPIFILCNGENTGSKKNARR